MEPLEIGNLPPQSLLLLDSAPIIYLLEGHPTLAPRFEPIFEAHAAGQVCFAVTTVATTEVLTGPLQAGDDNRARHYRTTLESWQTIPLDNDIAESAARIRTLARLTLPDAVQAASALAIDAAALVTHDRDFSRLHSLRVIS